MIGAGLGFYFRVQMLIIGVILSVAAMLGIGLAMGSGVVWPIVVSLLTLQLGFAAGSFAASLLAARTAAIDSHSKDSIAMLWRLVTLKGL